MEDTQAAEKGCLENRWSYQTAQGSNPLSAIFTGGLVISFYFTIRRETSFDDLMDVHVNSQ